MVSLTITPVNDAPTLSFVTNNVIVFQNCGPVTLSGFASTTVGPPNESGQTITNIVLLTLTNASLFAASPAISPAGTLTFTPATNTNGLALVTAQARDDGGTANGGTNGSTSRTFTITVIPVNHPPVATNYTYTLSGGVSLDIPSPGILGNDSDPDNDSLSATLVSGPQQGSLTLAPTGGFNYTLTNHFVGVDTFTYEANDGQTNSTPATVSITVSNTIRISSVAFSNGVVTMTWNSIAGKNYHLQYKDDFADPTWQDLTVDMTASGPNTTGTNTVGTAPHRLYRVFSPGN
jgi:hypothetical protein